MRIYKKCLIGLFLSIISLSTISAVDYSACPMGGTYGMMSGGYGIGSMLFSWITYLLVIGLIIAGIYWLVKSANRKE